jgi:hypothetical protein
MIERRVCSLRFVSPEGFSPKYRNHRASSKENDWKAAPEWRLQSVAKLYRAFTHAQETGTER